MSTESDCIAAFLATAPAQEVLSLTPMDTDGVVEMRRLRGERPPALPAERHAWGLTYCLLVAAERGSSWRSIVAADVVANAIELLLRDPASLKSDVDTHLSRARARANALVDDGDLVGAVTSLINDLSTGPAPLSRNKAGVLEIIGKKTARIGDADAVRKFIEVFV